MVRVVANCLSNYYALILLLFVGQVDVMTLEVLTPEVLTLAPLHNLVSTFVNQVRRFNAMVMFNKMLLTTMMLSNKMLLFTTMMMSNKKMLTTVMMFTTMVPTILTMFQSSSSSLVNQVSRFNTMMMFNKMMFITTVFTAVVSTMPNTMPDTMPTNTMPPTTVMFVGSGSSLVNQVRRFNTMMMFNKMMFITTVFTAVVSTMPNTMPDTMPTMSDTMPTDTMPPTTVMFVGSGSSLVNQVRRFNTMMMFNKMMFITTVFTAVMSTMPNTMPDTMPTMSDTMPTMPNNTMPPTTEMFVGSGGGSLVNQVGRFNTMMVFNKMMFTTMMFTAMMFATMMFVGSLVNQMRGFTAMVMFNCCFFHYVCARPW
ncbi:hypothetical protein Q9L58_004548 [Maublancomyces gigas]|uniref:NADH dehydrogenase subunit 6 n=1 Tax=Discina gigas TaxID=1032678 RepID=A0ABR3GKU6_9PEZI